MARSSAASRHMKATTAPRGVRHRTERHAPGSQQRRSQRTKGQGTTTAHFGSPTGRIASGKRPRRERGVPRPGRPRITGAQDRHGASSKPQLVANVAQIEVPATATEHAGLVRADGTRRAVDINLKGSDPRQKQALEQPRHPLELTAPCWKRRQCRARRLSGGASAPQRRRHGDLVSAS